MFQKMTQWWSKGTGIRVLMIGVPIVFVVVLVTAGIVLFSQKNNLNIFNAKDPFEGFSKLVLQEANARDNFVLTASSEDSLGVTADAVYHLTSKETIDTDRLKKSIRVSPEAEFALAKTADREWDIRLSKSVKPNTLVKIAVAAQYTDTAGQEQSRDYEWAFQVKDGFKVLNSLPRDTATGVPLNTGIEVTFSHDAFSENGSSFVIEPKVEGGFEKHGRTLVFVPKQLAPSTVYRVTIQKGFALSGTGDTLAEDYTFAFETQEETMPDEHAPWMHVYEKFQEVRTTDAPLIQLASNNVKDNTVRVSVYPLQSEAEYLAILAKRDRLPWWSYSKNKVMENTDHRTALLSFQAQIQKEESAQFIRFEQPLPPGYFFIDLSSEGVRDQVLMQVTDMAAYVNVAENKTMVWAVDLSEKKPAQNAQIELIGTQKRFVTDKDGVAAFATPDELVTAASDLHKSERAYLKVERNGKELILPATTLSNGYRYMESSSGEYWKYLYTDRPLYQPTDKVKIWGMIQQRNKAPVSDTVTVSLYRNDYTDYYYQPISIATQTLTLDALGSFTAEIPIQNLKEDGYTLELKVGDTVIENKYISVKAYQKPAYQLSLIPDKKVAYAGETIHLRAQATFFEGTPVPNLSLKYNSGHGVETVVTNDQGIVDLSYTETYEECKNDYSCWPRYAWLSIRPEDAELGEISADASVHFYGPKVTARTEVTYPESGKARLRVSVKQMDVEHEATDASSRRDPFDDLRPSSGTKVEGEVTKITYDRKEAGTYYDFINKRSYPRYSYTEKSELAGKISGVTDQDGTYAYEQNVERNTSYKVRIRYFDADGRSDNTLSSFYYYDGREVTRYQENNYPSYRVSMPEKDSFSVGDNVSVDFVNNDQSLPDQGSNYYLYAQYQNGLQEYAVSQNSAYSFPFEERDIPNVNITGVYFNGETFIVSETGWTGNSILFDKKDKTLDIRVIPDKPQYKPGEKVNLSIQTKDAKGNPVRAAVNMNLIDEAFYAVMDDQANPVDSVYSGLGAGSIFSTYSHQPPVNPFGGAEMGGCFLKGTKILMSDGSEKNIEDIKAGDLIRTLEDPRRNAFAIGTVTETYQHVVSHYLVINGQLRVTPEHIVYANLGFKPAGMLKKGDWMRKSDGEKVFVTSIETKREIVPVYNFRVDPQHTYFADGYFVHNEKGGGPREFFTDSALFQTVLTNSDGSAQTSFTLPDNITSWRVTAQGLSKGLDIGASVSKIPVSLPVFVEATIGSEYLENDKPIARLRSFGTALNDADRVTLSMVSPALGMTTPLTKESKAFASEFFELPGLKLGTYPVHYSLKSAKGNDAVTLPIDVIRSRRMMQVSETDDAVQQASVENTSTRPLSVTFTDRQRSDVYRLLQRLSWTWGDRIDQGLARKTAAELMNQLFDSGKTIPEFRVSSYQVPSSGGLALLPYSGEDLELSARVAQLGVAEFDDTALMQYFFKTLENKTSNPEEITLALYGLSAMQQPVLPRLEAWVKRDDLNVTEKLYSALAFYALGKGEKAREIYLGILQEYGQIKEPHIIIKSGNSNDEILKNTELALLLAVYLNEPQQSGLRGYLQFHRPHDSLPYLEDLVWAKALASRMPNRAATVRFTVGSETKNAQLEQPKFSYRMELQPGERLVVQDDAKDVVMTTGALVAMDESVVKKDPDVSIRREYYVNNAKTNTFHEKDLVEVRLIPEFSNNALDGMYQITDSLPSGLLPVTQFSQWGYSYDCNYRYPYVEEKQSVKYLVGKNWLNGTCKTSYIKYYARVKTKGTYQAEPALIQSMLNTDTLNFSSSETVTIQ